MSDPEEPRYDISLNQYALTMILRALEEAQQEVKNGHPEGAMVALNKAWNRLPRSVRAKFPDRPSAMLDKRYQATFTEEARKKTVEEALARLLSYHDGFPYRAGDPYTMERAEDDAKQGRIAYRAEVMIPDLVNELEAAFIEEMDAQNLYITNETLGAPRPMGDKQIRQTPPAAKKYDPSLSREVDSDA